MGKAAVLQFPTGWRRAATLNTFLIGILAVLLATLLGVSVHHAGSLYNNLIIFNGPCGQTSNLNLGLHLLINGTSTVIVSSSNFFMQILNAPSRKELDAAHAKNKPLEIGVSSLSNIPHVSRFKTAAWVVFLLSTIPIHLFFNSAVFETAFQGADFNATLATEAFVNGAPYYAPGASLMPSGAFDSDPGDLTGFGDYVDIYDYLNASSGIRQTISSIAARSSTWTRLDIHSCLQQYLQCSARQQYGDVIFVLDTKPLLGTPPQPFNASGWTRDLLFGDLKNYTGSVDWDKFVPADQTNSLWYSGACRMYSDSPPTDSGVECIQTCYFALGLTSEYMYSTGYDGLGLLGKGWNISLEYFNQSGTTEVERSPDLPIYRGDWIDTTDTSTKLAVQYCLAEPISPDCKVGVSNVMLLAVTLCVIVKTVQCIIVIARVKDEPLATPGDVIASFLDTADPTTEGKCTLTYSDLKGKQGLSSAANSEVRRAELVSGPRQWKSLSHLHLSDAVPGWTWFRTYALLVAVVIATVALFVVADGRNQSPLGTPGASFGQSTSNGLFAPHWFPVGSLIPSVLLANIPQLVLAFCYFAYNSILTRLEVEKEWGAYGGAYKPLRVSYPKGEQTSTYRLQLPYKYSIPLLIISTLLHWLVSNTLYVYVIEGGYINYGSHFNLPDSTGQGLTTDAFIGIGYSTPSILLALVLAILLSIIPLVLARWQRFAKRGDMVLCGASSLVISAACHPSLVNVKTDLSRLDTIQAEARPGSRNMEMETLISPIQTLPSNHKSTVGAGEDAEYGGGKGGKDGRDEDRSGVDHAAGKSVALSRRLLRWGVVPMPDSFRAQYAELKQDVGHLSFGVEEQDVQPPRVGMYYA